MTIHVGVLASAPIPGRCKASLLGAYTPEWAARLSAAMLRDTLDGLQAIDAARYVVFAARGDEGDDAAAVLARHVPAPWEIVLHDAADDDDAVAVAFAHLRRDASAADVVLATEDAPTYVTAPLEAALAAPRAHGRLVIANASGRARFCALATDLADAALVRSTRVDDLRAACMSAAVAFEALPDGYVVDTAEAVLTLVDELRRHPERAPRTAQFLVTNP